MSVSPDVAKEIKAHYQAGRGSIQDYARMYGLTVPQVLEIVEEEDLKTVTMGGDLIDASEIGRNNAAEIRLPEEVDVPFDLS